MADQFMEFTVGDEKYLYDGESILTEDGSFAFDWKGGVDFTHVRATCEAYQQGVRNGRDDLKRELRALLGAQAQV